MLKLIWKCSLFILIFFINLGCENKNINSIEHEDKELIVSNTNAKDLIWGYPSNTHLDEIKSLPPETKSLEEVLALIKSVEKAYPYDNWKTIAVRLRKTHYDSKLWNLLLIDSIEIKPANVKDGVPQSVIDILRKGNITFNDLEGNSIDITHIWALINALSSPKTDSLIDTISEVPMDGSVSWIGDLGSVVAEYSLNILHTNKTLEEYFRMYSGSSDLYGDIDGYGVFYQDIAPNTSLSKRIELFYKKNYINRFKYYFDATSIKTKIVNNQLEIDQSSIKNIIFPYVKRFTFFWTLHLSKMHKIECIAEEIDGKIYTDKEINKIVSLYTSWLIDHYSL